MRYGIGRQQRGDLRDGAARSILGEDKFGCDAGGRSASGEVYANVRNLGEMTEGGRDGARL